VSPLALADQINLGHSCSYFGENVPVSVFTFTSDSEAESVIENIMEVTGLPKNFVIKAAGVPNAAAVVIGSQRYVLYNQTFIRKITQQTNSDWTAYSIMAHEIGHHLSGHTLNEFGSRPSLELEADKYSGFILQKLGAKLSEAKLAIQLVAGEVRSNTHPAKHDRLAAITNGWIESCNQDPGCSSSSKSNNSSTSIKISAVSSVDRKKASSTLPNAQLSRAEQNLKSRIVKLQNYLNSKNCESGVVDGIIGSRTHSAMTWLANSGSSELKSNFYKYRAKHCATRYHSNKTHKEKLVILNAKSNAVDGMLWSLQRYAEDSCRLSNKPEPPQPGRRISEDESISSHLSKFWRPPIGLQGGESCTIQYMRDNARNRYHHKYIMCNPKVPSLIRSVETAVSESYPIPEKIMNYMLSSEGAWSVSLVYDANNKYNHSR